MLTSAVLQVYSVTIADRKEREASEAPWVHAKGQYSVPGPITTKSAFDLGPTQSPAMMIVVFQIEFEEKSQQLSL